MLNIYVLTYMLNIMLNIYAKYNFKHIVHRYQNEQYFQWNFGPLKVSAKRILENVQAQVFSSGVRET